MTEPEIARRCPACGASIRELAFFCPQCGNEIAKPGAESPTTNTSVVTAPLDGSPVRDGGSANETVVEPRPATVEQQPKAVVEQTSKVIATPSKKVVAPATSDRNRPRRQRATALVRDVEGDVVHRVQKLRQISTVVLDEAGYDPGLRFLLVAAALFLLFLIIVLLNKFIG